MARHLLTIEFKACRAQVEGLNAAANEIYVNDDLVTRRGLFTKDRRELSSMADYIRQMESAGREGRRIAHLLGGAVEAWEKIVTDSNDLAIRIETLLRRGD